MKRRRLPSPDDLYLFEEVAKCPVCDGTDGEADTWTKYKELDRENLELLRFLAGSPPMDRDKDNY
jgi:hypothetical protein